jgi:hypothetical protein
MPVGRTLAARTSTSVIGTAAPPVRAAAATAGLSRVRASAGTAASSTVPHAWHSPHRPDHRVVRQPHSLQRKTDPVDDFPMTRTVLTGCDTPID